MDIEVQVALLHIVPPTIAALGTILAVVLADRRAHRKLDHITELTNSTLKAALERIDELEEMVKVLIAEKS